jgi:hypothetical protein
MLFSKPQTSKDFSRQRSLREVRTNLIISAKDFILLENPIVVKLTKRSPLT